MTRILKILILINIAIFGLFSCSNDEMDEKNKNISMEIVPKEPMVFDFDFSFENNVGDTVTLSKNYFQGQIWVTNKNTEYALVIVGFSLEATSSSDNGGIKVDKISISPSDSVNPESDSYIAAIGAASSGGITLNVGNLNPNASGLSYSVKLTAKGYFSDKADYTQQLYRFSREFFFVAQGSN